MSKREELIEKLEGKLNEKQRIAKRFQPSPTDYPSLYPDPNRQKMYEMNIKEMGRNDHEIYDLVELIKLLPKEDTPQVKQKRDQLASTIEGEAEGLYSLNRQRQDAQSDMMRRVLDNQTSDLGGSLDAHKKLLSVL